MAKEKSNVATATFSPQQVQMIENRLGEIQGRIYLVGNMASLIAPSTDEDIELRTVLHHMNDILIGAANGLASDEITPYAERTKEAPTAEAISGVENP
jgi:hypothetical protein